MRLHVVDHPLVAHKLTTLRDRRTDSATFRRLADELVTLLAYEATRDVRTEQVDIVTPVAPTTGVKLSYPRPLVVPILRAGLGMLDGMVRRPRRRPPRWASWAWCATRRRSRRPRTRPGCRTTSPGARCTSSTRCWPPAAPSSRRSRS